jgi:hypothetical protein
LILRVCVCVCVVAIYSFFLKYVGFLFVLQNSGKSESSHSNSLSSDVVTETGTPEADSTDDNNEQGKTGNIGYMCDIHQELFPKVEDQLLTTVLFTACNILLCTFDPSTWLLTLFPPFSCVPRSTCRKCYRIYSQTIPFLFSVFLLLLMRK